MRNLAGLQDRLINDATRSHPSLTRGQVWCRTCGHTRRVDSAEAMRKGWPKHCGYTMTIDSPDEQEALA
jgi:hypothetical protein